MNEDKNNPDNLINTNSVPDHPEVVAIQSYKSKKWLVAIAAAVLLLAGAAVAAFMWPGFLKDKDGASTSTVTPNTIPKQYFFYSLQKSEKYGDQPYFMSGLGTNLPVQFKAGSNEFAVATSGFDAMEGSSDPNSFAISKGVVGGDLEVVLSGKDQYSIADWVYTTDGKEVYYLEQKWGPDRKNLLATELHKVDLATKKDALIGVVDRPTDGTHSRLFSVSSDNSVRFYSDRADGIHQIRLDRATAKIDTKKIIDRSALAVGGLVQNTLSPDGTKLLYENNIGPGKLFKISVIDVKTGAVSTLLQSDDQRMAYGNAQWSPNGEQVALNTYPFGIEGQQQVGFKNQLITVAVADAKATVLLEDASPGIDAADYTKHFFSAHGWSPDGAYIVYSNSTNLLFYDLAQKKSTHKLEVFKGYFTFDSGSAYGWATY
jgi:hypothetical protein